MDKATINDIVIFLKESLIQYGINVDSIALFGTALSGKMDEESDIDLIIISEDFRDKDIFERSKLTMAPEVMTFKKYKVPMDILNMSPEEYYEMNLKKFFQNKIVA
jgi:predicted nucleotidyltransferase